MLLRSYLIADGVHLNDTAKSSSVEVEAVGVGEQKIIEEFLKTGKVRSCKFLLLKLIWECKTLSK